MRRSDLVATDLGCAHRARTVTGEGALFDPEGHRFESFVEHLGAQLTVGFGEDVDGASIGKPHAGSQDIGACPATQFKDRDELAESAFRLGHARSRSDHEPCVFRMPRRPSRRDTYMSAAIASAVTSGSSVDLMRGSNRWAPGVTRRGPGPCQGVPGCGGR